MALLGTVEFMKQEYVFMETSFTKGSRQLIVASYDNLVSEEEVEDENLINNAMSALSIGNEYIPNDEDDNELE